MAAFSWLDVHVCACIKEREKESMFLALVHRLIWFFFSFPPFPPWAQIGCVHVCVCKRRIDILKMPCVLNYIMLYQLYRRAWTRTISNVTMTTDKRKWCNTYTNTTYTIYAIIHIIHIHTKRESISTRKCLWPNVFILWGLIMCKQGSGCTMCMTWLQPAILNT